MQQRMRECSRAVVESGVRESGGGVKESAVGGVSCGAVQIWSGEVKVFLAVRCWVVVARGFALCRRRFGASVGGWSLATACSGRHLLIKP
jgi:hypothetical protein